MLLKGKVAELMTLVELKLYHQHIRYDNEKGKAMMYVNSFPSIRVHGRSKKNTKKWKGAQKTLKTNRYGGSHIKVFRRVSHDVKHRAAR